MGFTLPEGDGRAAELRAQAPRATERATGARIPDAGHATQYQDPTVSYLASSSTYLVGHDRFSVSGSDWNVWAREHEADGTAVAAGFQVSSSPQAGSHEFFTAIAANTLQGEWLQVWQDDRDQVDYDVYGQRYSSDTTPPAVVRFAPQDTATGVFLDTSLLVDFSQDMDDTTISSATITLVEGGVGTITTTTVAYVSSSRQAKVTVAGDLPEHSLLTLTVTTGVENSLGVALPASRAASFNTSDLRALDDDDNDGLLNLEEVAYGTSPTSADSDSDGIDDWDELFVTFTDPMNDDTDGDSVVDGSDTSPAGTPGDAPLAPDVAPVASFEVTTIAPTGFPASRVRVLPDVTFVVTFNHAVDVATVTSNNVTLVNAAAPSTLLNLALETSASPNVLVFRPTTALTTGQNYTFSVLDAPSVGGPVEDVAGDPITFLHDTFATVATTAADSYEATHYYETLGLTDWEQFRLLAPTASGRRGHAVVVPSTRKLFLTETDVVTPGRGIAVALTRVHRNNDSAASGMFGNNWHFTYDRSFTSVADQGSDGVRELEHRSADGRVFTYTSQSSQVASTYTSPPGFYDTLKTVTIGGTKLLKQRTKHGMELFYEFHQSGNTTVEDPDALPLGAVGRLVRLRDPNQNVVVINRAAANHASRPNRIESIVDDLDRTTTFTYSATAGQLDLCVTATQFTGAPTTRSWTYTYDANRSLIQVETPTSDWNDEGSPRSGAAKEREYTYTSSGGVYSLTSVKDGRGNTSFRVFYDANRDVMQVDYGSGADAGTAVYSFRRTAATFVNKATQIDRNGNVLVLEHDDLAAPPFWVISTQQIFSRGLHPNLPGAGEPGSYNTRFTHDSDSELIELPNTNVYRWIRDSKGNVVQFIRKAATRSELQSNGSDYKREEDIVVEYAYEAVFNRVIRITESRGNNKDFVGDGSNIVSTTEVVGAQTPRAWSAAAVDEVKRNAFTRFLYHDHENVGSRLTADTTAIGDTVSLVRQLPKSYGRTASNATRDPPDVGVFTDADSDGFVDRGGNLFAVRGARPTYLNASTGAVEASRQVIERNLTYNQWGQRVLEIEPDGDRNRLEHHLGTFDLTNNPERGYLRYAVTSTAYTDADLDLAEGDPSASPSGTGLELTTAFPDFDAFGNALSVTSPRGFTSTRQVNLLNLVTRTTTPSPFDYDTDYVYDGNNNLVQVKVENSVPVDTNDDGVQDSGEQAVVAAHPVFTHQFAYTTANRLARQDLDAYGSSPSTLTTSWAYDRKQLMVAVREHEGNTHLRRFDERDLLYETVEGSNVGLESELTKYDYDHNRNLLQVIDDDGNSDPSLVLTYDVFDRVIKVEDELGDTLETTFDVASLVRQEVVTGLPRGDPGDSPTTILANSLVEYDELGRPFQTTQELFGALVVLGPSGLNLTRMTPPVDLTGKRVMSGELVNTTAAYSADSLVLSVFDDNPNGGSLAAYDRRFTYDTADRLTRIQDPFGSQVDLLLDDASNVLRTTETEVSDDGLTSETYLTERFFDEQDRLIAQVSHLGNTSRLLYDSRSNVVQASDAMGLLAGATLSSLRTASEHGTFPQFSAPLANASINGRGNTVRFTYDGVSRPVQTIRDLRSDGTGAGTVLTGQEIVTTQVWDGNSRLAGQSDPLGNLTSYAFDAQNRPIRTLFADGTQQRTLWNAVDTVATEVDARGVLKQYAYDVAERRASATVSNLPTGAGQTTFLAWRWDGLHRNTRAEDNDTITELSYDSLSRQVEDEQSVSSVDRANSLQNLTAPVVGAMKRAFDGVGNLRRQVYPSGAVTINRSYDAANRLTEVKDGSTSLATYKHIGPGSRRLSRTYSASGVKLSCGYDGDRRVTRHDHVKATGTQRIRGFSYAWDRAGNRKFERRLTVNSNASETAGPGEFYRYDSVYRLAHVDQDVASSTLDAVTNNATSVTSPVPVPATSSDFAYDAAGNRRQTSINGSTQLYDLRAGLPELDAAMNQYTRVGSTYQTHDQNGNTLSSSELGLQRFFDASDQLVQWTESSTSKNVRYQYDALGRRVSKRMLSGGSTWTLFFYDGWQDAEETTSAGTVVRRYVYGEGIDEVLRATIPDNASDLDDNGSTSGNVDIYYHDNSIGSVVAVTNASGTVLESYRYEAFGQATIFDQSGAVVSTTQVGQPFMFTGRRLDWEEGSGLLYYRLRYYDPAAGRFVSRDPLGLWGDPGQNGSGQSYCANNPVNRVDPMGLDDAAAGPKDIPIDLDQDYLDHLEYLDQAAEKGYKLTIGRPTPIPTIEELFTPNPDFVLGPHRSSFTHKDIIGAIVGTAILGFAGWAIASNPVTATIALVVFAGCFKGHITYDGSDIVSNPDLAMLCLPSVGPGLRAAGAAGSWLVLPRAGGVSLQNSGGPWTFVGTPAQEAAAREYVARIHAEFKPTLSVVERARRTFNGNVMRTTHAHTQPNGVITYFGQPSFASEVREAIRVQQYVLNEMWRKPLPTALRGNREAGAWWKSVADAQADEAMFRMGFAR